MTWNDFFQSLKDGRVDRVYLFSGPEEWTKNNALQALRDALLPPGLEQLNDVTMEGCTAQQIIDAADTMPMMCERRIVTVRDWVPLLPGKSRNEEAEVERLQAWLENPPETCVTVFYMRTDPDSRKKAATLLKKKGVSVQFDFLSDAELSQWCARRLKPHGKKIDARALSTLSFMAGRELTRLAGELDKLTAYVGERGTIVEDDVKAIVPASLEYNVFELINRLLEGNLGEAQRMTNSLLQNGQTAIGILAMLTRQLRQLTHMRLALDAGRSVQDVQDTLKIHPYAAKQTARQCRGLSANALKTLYEECVNMDYQIKSGRLRDFDALSVAIFNISNSNLAGTRKP